MSIKGSTNGRLGVADRSDSEASGEPGPSGSAPARAGVVRRARRLPGTRAVVGGLLVTVSALGAFVAAQGGGSTPGADYVIASRTLAPGQVLAGDDVAVVRLDLPPAQGRGTFASEAAVVGSVIRGPVQAGAVLTEAVVDVASAGDTRAGSTLGGRYREVSVAVPRARALDGVVAPGDRVDIVSSDRDESRVLVERAVVLAVSAGGGGLVTGTDVVVTLALERGEEAVAVAHGGAQGNLTILRSTRTQDPLPGRYRPDDPPVPVPVGAGNPAPAPAQAGDGGGVAR